MIIQIIGWFPIEHVAFPPVPMVSASFIPPIWIHGPRTVKAAPPRSHFLGMVYMAGGCSARKGKKTMSQKYVSRFMADNQRIISIIIMSKSKLIALRFKAPKFPFHVDPKERAREHVDFKLVPLDQADQSPSRGSVQRNEQILAWLRPTWKKSERSPVQLAGLVIPAKIIEPFVGVCGLHPFLCHSPSECSSR